MPTMDVEHCVIAVTSELARFLSAADKTPLQRLIYMSCRPPLTLAGFGVFDGAKLQFFSKLDKKSLPLPVLGAKAIKIFPLFASLNTRSPHKALSFSTGRLLYLCYSILFSSANRCNKGFILYTLCVGFGIAYSVPKGNAKA